MQQVLTTVQHYIGGGGMIILLQKSFKSHFSDFIIEEHPVLAVLNPFSLSDENILNVTSNIQVEFINLETNPLLEMKF